MLRDRGANARPAKCLNSVLNVKALVGTFNQEKALVGAFYVIVQPVVEPMDRFAALVSLVVLLVTLFERSVTLPPHLAQHRTQQ